MVQTKALWWHRYKWLAALVAVIAVVMGLMMAKGVVDHYRFTVGKGGDGTYEAYQSTYRHQNKPAGGYAQYRRDRVVIYFDGKEYTEMTRDGRVHAVMPIANYGMTVDVGLIVGAALLGALLIAWDHASGFTRWLFGLGIVRRKYYRLHSLGLVGLITLGLIAHFGSYVTLLATNIPAADLNLSGQGLALMLLYNWVVAVAAGLIGQLIGLTFSHWLAVGLATTAFLIMIYGGMGNLSNMLLSTHDYAAMYNVMITSPFGNYWRLLLFSAVIGLIGVLWGQALFARWSMDHNGWLRDRVMLWPSVIIFALLFCGFTIKFGSNGKWSPTSLIAPVVAGVIALGVAYWHKRQQA